MEPRFVDAVCQQVYTRFPEVNGCAPKIQLQPAGEPGAAKKAPSYLFIFSGKGLTANGKAIARTVRVVVSERGKIVKMTTSR